MVGPLLEEEVFPRWVGVEIVPLPDGLDCCVELGTDATSPAPAATPAVLFTAVGTFEVGFGGVVGFAGVLEVVLAGLEVVVLGGVVGLLVVGLVVVGLLVDGLGFGGVGLAEVGLGVVTLGAVATFGAALGALVAGLIALVAALTTGFETTLGTTALTTAGIATLATAPRRSNGSGIIKPHKHRQSFRGLSLS